MDAFIDLTSDEEYDEHVLSPRAPPAPVSSPEAASSSDDGGDAARPIDLDAEAEPMEQAPSVFSFNTTATILSNIENQPVEGEETAEEHILNQVSTQLRAFLTSKK